MNKIMLLVLLTIIMIAVAVPFIIRSLLWNRVLKQLHNGHYDKVLTMLNSKAFTLFFKEYDRNWNTLRVYLAQGNNRKNRPESCSTAGLQMRRHIRSQVRPSSISLTGKTGTYVNGCLLILRKAQGRKSFYMTKCCFAS